MKTSNSYLTKAIYWIACSTLYLNIGITQSSGGLILDEKGYEDVPMAKIFSDKSTSLPDCVDLTMYSPYAHLQGASNSCVGWAIANAYTIHKAIPIGERRRGLIDTHLRYSASFIYNQVKVSCGSGARLVDGLNLLFQKGICRNTTFPSSKPCDEQPNKAAFVEAQQYKLFKPYKRVFQKKKDIILNTKRQLVYNNPVIVGFSACPDMRKWRGQKFWYPQNDPKKSVGHAMVVVGYDEEGFKLLNSFGESWGQQGFIKIPYLAYENYAKEAFVLDYGNSKNMESNGNIANDLSFTLESGIILQQANYNEHDELFFDDLNCRFSEESYRYNCTLNPSAEIKQEIRLEMHLSKGMHAYVFNLDSQQRVTELGTFGDNGQDTVQYLPPLNRTFIIPPKGTELIGILFSYTPIADYKSKIKNIQQHPSDDLMEILEREFDLIDNRLLRYNKETPYVEATTYMGDGSVLPIMLEISIK